MFQVGLDIRVEKLGELLQIIQDFDPAGVGASDLQECLKLQLERRRGTTTAQLAYEIIDKAFEAFSKRHYEKIQRQFNISESDLKAADTGNIPTKSQAGKQLERFFLGKHDSYISPDFIVDENDGELVLSSEETAVFPHYA